MEADSLSMNQRAWRDDPKHVLFTLARYKFVAKMLAGKGCVLEVGCGDGMGAHIVAQSVGHVLGIDRDSVDHALAGKRANMDFFTHDILAEPLVSTFDAVYCLDVFEHIPPHNEWPFLDRLKQAAPVCIIGTPSLESQKYASPLSKQYHVNCKSGDELKATLQNHWSQVFLFSMSDEVIHTGFYPMAHYLVALCVR